MGGRGAAFGSGSKKPKSLKKQPKTKKVGKVEKGKPMGIDKADNHNANPNWHGGVIKRAEMATNRRQIKSLKSQHELLKKQIENEMKKGHSVRGLRKKLSESTTKINKLIDKYNGDLRRDWLNSQNCQRAVVAYELRRRGYKVKASPREAETFGAGYRASIGAFGERKKINVPRLKKKRNQAIHKEMLKRLKPGERGVISWGWDGSRVKGHTINVERTKNGVLYVDAQIGKKTKTFPEYMRRDRDTVRSNTVDFVRTDNVKIDIANMIKKDVIRPA
ncbi:toxin glutamine deamidase domain-containing protein [Ligilactobacillus saerimneri]|uniref:toxin glutamine deamidase domain-containing protein n=1 Tax=Ligilactobacillus saerimneri TaxID=228229 RepID=UPI0022A6BB26|nr:toxin glutamine deamidase domain-containing protein [Ligilactobacillus saerimneri]MCZ0891982.1 toxin glutamine deamidase domain-containing protein [Ligilactobacillus saerimneri]